MSPPDVGFLVLLRSLWPVPQVVVPGSIIVMANCGHRGWISPSGRQHWATDSGLYTLCGDCFPTGWFEDQTVERQEVPGSLDELERTAGPIVADRARAFIRGQRRRP